MQSFAPINETELQLDESLFESVGKTLNRIRLEQGHSLEEVTKSTKIRTHFLALLEEDNFKELPGTVFTTGFIRSYCEYLNISAEPLIAQYITQSSNKEMEAPFKLYVPQKSERKITPRIVLISTSIIAFASALWHLTDNKDVILTKDIIQKETKQKNDLLIKKRLAIAPVETKQNEQMQQAENTSTDANKSKDKQLVTEKDSTSMAIQALPEKEHISELKDFSIVANEETWLKITNDQGVRLKVSFLKKGEVFSLESYLGNLISVGNAENVDFIQGNLRVKGAEYLETISGFAESKKIVVPQTPDMIQSVSSDMPKNAPPL